LSNAERKEKEIPPQLKDALKCINKQLDLMEEVEKHKEGEYPAILPMISNVFYPL
jgi:hypothetical protein